MTRKTTPQTIPKLGKNPRDREKEWEEDRWWDEERESFPQYWYVIKNTVLPFALLPSLYVSQLRLWGPSPQKTSISITPHCLSPGLQVICVTLGRPVAAQVKLSKFVSVRGTHQVGHWEVMEVSVPAYAPSFP
jgi:hypothetical protein